MLEIAGGILLALLIIFAVGLFLAILFNPGTWIVVGLGVVVWAFLTYPTIGMIALGFFVVLGLILPFFERD